MHCPFFTEENYVGVCSASQLPYVPSIDDLEKYCFTQKCRECRILRTFQSSDEGKRWQYSRAAMRAWINDKPVVPARETELIHE